MDSVNKQSVRITKTFNIAGTLLYRMANRPLNAVFFGCRAVTNRDKSCKISKFRGEMVFGAGDLAGAIKGWALEAPQVIEARWNTSVPSQSPPGN